MAKRMTGDETWFRIYVEVEYDIRYRSYNKKWDYQAKTTGDIEGSNPMYVQHPEDTHENWYTYLGPYNSLKALEREFTKFEKHYRESDSYRNLRFERGPITKAEWVEV